MKRFIRSVKFGIAGHFHVARTEPNMKIHWFAAASVVAAGFLLRVNPMEWALVVGCIGIMLALECVNTAIERLADRVSPTKDPLIGQAKDSAAAAALIMSVACAIIGGIVFVPKLGAFFS